jgi:hypothetical protein
MENWKTAKKQVMEMEPAFVLIGGDICRDGTLHRWELEDMKADIDEMGIPYHAVPGNMDVGNKFTAVEGPDASRRDTEIGITSDTLAQFESVFGPSMWSRDYGNVRVSGFCDMLLGSGLPEERRLKAWLDEQKRRPQAEHQLWVMHYALFVDSPYEPRWDIRNPEEYMAWYFTVDQAHREYLFDLFQATGTERVLTGHIHCRKDHYAGDIHFDLAAAIGFPQWPDHWPDGDPTLGFYRFDVEEAGLHRSFVPLEHVSERTDGYGPGGHPLPEARDYSLAWEK